MTMLLACISVMITLGAIIWAARPGQSDADPEKLPSTQQFSLQQAVILTGTQMNQAACCNQRTELRRILTPLLEGGFRIVEVYGEEPPSCNGEVLDWLDNQLLRDSLNAQEGFHLIFVDDTGQMVFHATRPVTAEALLHVFDLWSLIEGDAGEALAEHGGQTGHGDQADQAAATPAIEHAPERPAKSEKPAPQRQTEMPGTVSGRITFAAAGPAMQADTYPPASLTTAYLTADTAPAAIRPLSLPVETFSLQTTSSMSPGAHATDRLAGNVSHRPAPKRAHRRAPSRVAAMVNQRRA